MLDSAFPERLPKNTIEMESDHQQCRNVAHSSVVAHAILTGIIQIVHTIGPVSVSDRSKRHRSVEAMTLIT